MGSLWRRGPRNASYWQILKQTLVEWNEDNAPRLAAALAYYAMFSIAPLILFSIAVASFFVGEEAARGELFSRLEGYVGDNGASAIQALVGSAQKSERAGRMALTIGFATLLFGASGVFGQLKDSLNQIWGVKAKRTGITGFIVNRLLASVMVLFIGLLVMGSVLLTTLISALIKFAGPWLTLPPPTLHLVDLLASFALITVLFGVLFKTLPDVKLAWKNVLLGAIFTSILFSIGKYGIGLYIARGGMANSYGAAGSLVVLLVWVYYSALIFFLGAEFTQVYTKMRHVKPELEEGAEVMSAEEVANLPRQEKAASAD